MPPDGQTASAVPPKGSWMRATADAKTVVAVWLVGSAAVSIVVAMLSLVYWQITYTPEPNVPWRPIHEFGGMLMLIPVGWMLSIIMPWGWLNLAGLVWALKKGSLKPLLLSAVGTIAFGLFWPLWFVGMMGI
jgi:hypothetical protein